MKKYRLILTLLILIVIVLLWPVETVIVPAWRIKIIHESGKPLPEKFVRQSWKHYSAELDAAEHLEDAWTDADGYVSFPERTIYASLFTRVLSPTINLIQLQVHASFGPRASVTAWNEKNFPSSIEYDSRKPLPTELVVKTAK